MSGFVPPPYPQDRLKPLAEICEAHDGGMVNLSIGAPYVPPPESLMKLLDNPTAAMKYPASAGSEEFRSAAAKWLSDLGAADLDAEDVAASIGSKEFVASLPGFLKLRTPEKSTILYPGVSYPTYAMGAQLGSCKPVPVSTDELGRMDLASISKSDIDDALCIWVNTPNNPTGALEDLEAVVEWGRANNVLVVSDECYIEFTWTQDAETVLKYGNDNLLAVHSLSKRSNFAGLRSGFYAGDRDLVHYLSEVRKHGGLMQSGPVQAASVGAFKDNEHVVEQRAMYKSNMERLIYILGSIDVRAELPGGGFYLWVKSNAGTDWKFAEHLAKKLGVLGIPGSLYGEAGSSHIRLAAVTTSSQLDLLEARAN